jgi:hypothetical protein
MSAYLNALREATREELLREVERQKAEKDRLRKALRMLKDVAAELPHQGGCEGPLAYALTEAANVLASLPGDGGGK